MKKSDLFTCIATISVFVVIAGTTAATTIHVTGVTGIGAPTIQSGVDAASPGDTVLVHCGTYYEHNIEMSSGIVLRSATGEADCVTIDVDASAPGLRAENLETAIKVEGFRVENGWACFGGGAMVINSTDAIIKNCYFANNYSSMCAMPSWGGAVALRGGSFEITNCVFTGNSGGLVYGAALSIRNSDAILTRCIVMDNGGPNGGAISLEGGTFEVNECYIADNYGEYPYSVGGLCVGSPFWGSQVSLLNSTITGNTAGTGGGVFIETGSELTAFNTDIRDNVAANGPDGYCKENSTTLLTCCDVVEGQWFIEEGAVWEVDNSGCGVATESMTWSRVKALYR